MSTAPIERPETPPRSVFARAVTILAAFATSPTGECGLTELAATTGLPLTTVHRLCHQLEQERVLEKSRNGHYRVGLRLWELGLLAPRTHGLREAALPFLEDLYEVTHSNVQLVVLDGAESVVVERLRARSSVQLVGRAGGRLPLHATSGGIVLLAGASPAVVDTALAGELERFTAATICDPERLRMLIDATRRQGHVVLNGHLTEGGLSIAAPVRSRSGAVVAAISLVAEARDASPLALLPAVLTTARGISRALPV